MRMNSLSAGALLAAALAVGLGQDVIAKPGTHSAADIAAIHDYTLTPGFLNKWKAMAADPEAPACSLMTLNLHGDSLNEVIDEYDARPGNHAYLRRHGLSSREMILGTSILAAAALQEIQRSHPGYVKGDASRLVSPQNMAFYQAHEEEIHALMQKAGQARLRQNGGELADCMKSK